MRRVPFDAPENQVTIVCKHVIDEGKDVTVVSYDEVDDMWQFLCNGQHNDASQAMLVCLVDPCELDESLGVLVDMTEEFVATRQDRNSEWVISRRK